MNVHARFSVQCPVIVDILHYVMGRSYLIQVQQYRTAQFYYQIEVLFSEKEMQSGEDLRDLGWFR